MTFDSLYDWFIEAAKLGGWAGVFAGMGALWGLRGAFHAPRSPGRGNLYLKTLCIAFCAGWTVFLAAMALSFTFNSWHLF